MDTYSNPIIDLHTDYVLTLYDKGQKYGVTTQTDYHQIKKANVRTIFAGFSYDDEFQDTDYQLSLLRQEISNKNFTLISKYSDLKSVIQKPEIPPGIVLHIEGAKLINSISDLHNYYSLGVRSIGLTHNHRNNLATGCKDGNSSGLSDLGKQIVREAQALNMVLDASHLNERSFYDMLNLTDKPIIVTHGNTYNHCPSPRNFTDQQIKDLAEQGGVIGIFFSAAYVNPNPKSATLLDVIKHCLHIVEVGGINCLAIGSDFGGITTGLPVNLENTSSLANLINLLHKSGFSLSDIKKVCYQNAFNALKRILSQ